MTKKITLVSTPIGNLKDISLRALDTLRDSDIILCEDTRVSQKLLNHYQINNKKLISYHKFNEYKMLDLIDNYLNQGLQICLISDAGVPTISDPGQILVNWAHENDIEVDIIPGANALISAFALSGYKGSFYFGGFLDSKKQQIIKQISLLDPKVSYIFYISPFKLVYTLEIIRDLYGEEIDIFLIKEITKIYQKYYRGTPDKILNNLSAPKGEFTIILKLKEKKSIKKNKYEQFSKVK
ncbi:Ribosomal RNA small subunit methyltransferase I [Mesomycoplasma conjunctivae]|uniref:Ribosomal RNA small subunit methyltransferase I n=1 Tax=Mesomycoplasma conjunctivae (strain ATCC 25834 / NCTC 10147 / HRC/581) TaxID=572263 RepID=RSMI_MESCH|nr:16S rRNA (cytidine(1402)-2'-O)-methyltransferase [Mesomycoplasma conjunctivae]C5J6H5.1 RecName: Full=Ribosomal RNA small subunit methyltransferase I; AltName: Full=16S rRNA 2'-O-ribose C1402 methyltransferase; AltName: Full=rRNA (cytidine-2'-O-)-methyltransferase RsmI [Mesomycoplasma conjunctivae HRC/581]CAT05067.1 UPF0011 protein MYPU_0540 [Mesomycoplasma conjunctivae]VEU66276.1 Ribosomal RNA small subunit methyltransferase I [Mesomycoplasma conjunctivae]